MELQILLRVEFLAIQNKLQMCVMGKFHLLKSRNAVTVLKSKKHSAQAAINSCVIEGIRFFQLRMGFLCPLCEW